VIDLDSNKIKDYFKSQKESWSNIARDLLHDGKMLIYVEYPHRKPQSNVVLGDPLHEYYNLKIVYKNAPQSLREVEETTGFEV